jgi:hypothetical protein
MPNEPDPKAAPPPPGSGSGAGAGTKPGSGTGPSQCVVTPQDNDKPPQNRNMGLAGPSGGRVGGAVSALIGTRLR